MSTFSQLVDDTLLYLHGFTTQQDQATYLTSPMTAGALTMTIADASALSRGLVEIDGELIWIDSVSGTTATIPPYGRGQYGTTAATHASGVKIASSPLFPRASVKKAILESLQSVYPRVWAVGATTFTFNPAVTTYALPAGSINALSVTWQSIGPSREWLPVRRYDIDNTANTEVWPTGSTISLYDAIVPGRTVRVVYTKQPSLLVDETDVFTTVTGLPSSMEDVIRLGAAYRVVAFLDAPHLSGNSAEADLASNQRQVGGAGTLSKYLYQMYQARLAEEVNKLQDLYTIRTRYTR